MRALSVVIVHPARDRIACMCDGVAAQERVMTSIGPSHPPVFDLGIVHAAVENVGLRSATPSQGFRITRSGRSTNFCQGLERVAVTLDGYRDAGKSKKFDP